MLNLMKSDLFKLRKTRFFWICLAIGMILAGSMVFLEDYLYHLDPGFASQLGELSLAAQIRSFLSSDTILLLTAIVISLFVGGEFTHGTIKTIASKSYSRLKIYCSKLFVGILVSSVLLLAAFLTSSVTALLLWGMGEIPSGFWTEMIGTILIQLLLNAAYTSLFVMFSMLIRQNGGSLAANICFLEFIPSVLMLLDLLFNKVFHLEIVVSDYFLSAASSAVLSQPLKGTLVVSSVLTGIVYLILAAAAGSASFIKRDIK